MQASSRLSLLGGHAQYVLDHVSDAIEDVMVVVLCLPHEGRGADDLVLLVHIGLVMQLESRSTQGTMRYIMRCIFVRAENAQHYVTKHLAPKAQHCNSRFIQG